MFELTVKLGDRLIQKFRGHSPINIGRDPGCDLMLDNLGVSRRHAQLREVDGRYVVEDLKSTNGVMVNGHRISSAEVRPGDEIRIGKFVVTFDVMHEESGAGRLASVDINQTIAISPGAMKRPPSLPRFAASVSRSVFHAPDCNWIKATPKNHKVFYENEDEARRAGKRPCKTCLPDLHGF